MVEGVGSFDDERALAEIAAGELSGLEQLYRELRVAVFAVALAVVGDRSLAEDVLHDVFVRVWETADPYRAKTRPRAWVLAIARNLAIDTVRRRDREPPLEEAREALEDGALGEFSWTEALVRLSPLEREIVALHLLGELTHREIAGQMGLPAGTVRWKYRLALSRLAPFVSERRDR